MRRSRRLTTGERWEVGLFLSLLIVACLCLTAALNLNALPRMFAAGYVVEREQILPDPTPADVEILPLSSEPTVELVPAEPFIVEDVPVPPVQKPVQKPAAKPTPTKPAKDTAANTSAIKVYNGKKYRYVKTLTLRVTAYAPDPRCTWPYPGTTTASGKSVKTNGGRLVAADPKLIPLHSLVVVPGYASGAAVPVLDTGGAIKGRRLDVMLPTFEQAKEWGVKSLQVKIYEEVK